MLNNFTGWFIAICWGIFLIFITIGAFLVKRTVETDRRWKWGWLVLSMALVALLLISGYATHLEIYMRQTMPWPHMPVISIIADLLVLAGLLIALWGRSMLGRNWNLNPGIKEDHELIERGPYAYVRHPMYTGLLLMAFGTVIWYDTWIGYIIFIGCFLGTWLKLQREEKILIKHFGERYPDYQARVKALIPFIL